MDMAGLTLGGGYGPLNGVAGLAADNLLSAEVVLADGTVAVATESSEAELARDGRHYAIRTRNLAGLTAGTVDALVAAGAARTSPLSAINLHHFHGAATGVPLPATAFGVRQPHFMTEILASWRPDAGQDADSAASHRRWALATAEQLSPHALPGGYSNLLIPDEPERVDHAYGPNAARLIAAKKAYDPGSIFTATPLPGVAAPGR
jgi:FAD/FMN-containing dehydrogenase